MATVIDALVVTLGLDPTNFTKGQKQAAASFLATKNEAANTAKAMEQEGQRAAAFFSRLRREAVALYATITGVRALRNFGEDAAASDAAVGRLANTLGIAADKLSAYDQMAQRVGGAQGSISTSFSSLNDKLQAFRLFGQALPQTFQALQINLSDPVTGAARSVVDIYNDALDAMHARSPQERNVIAGEMGFGQETVNLSALSRGERDKLLQQQSRLGTVTAEQAAVAERLQRAWLDLSQAIESTWRQLRTELEPAITAVLKAFTDVVLWLSGDQFKPTIDDLKENLQWLANYLGSQKFRDDMMAFGRGLRDLGEAVASLLRYLGLLPASADGSTAPASPNGVTGGLTGITTPSGRPLFGMTDAELAQRQQQNGNPWAELYRRNMPSWLGGNGGGRDANGVGANHRTAMKAFTDAGYTAEQASGLVANLDHESSLNPQVRAGDGGRSHGIGQWNDSRLRNFMDRNGGKMPEQTDLQTQLNFAIWELSENGPEASAGRQIRSARSAREAGQIGSRKWLRPGVDEANRAREERERGDTANNFFPALTGAPTAGAAVPSPSTGAAATPATPGPGASIDPALSGGARLSAMSRGGNVSTSTNEVTVGTVNVNTQATDARGIARDIGAELQRYAFADQAARGLA